MHYNILIIYLALMGSAIHNVVKRTIFTFPTHVFLECITLSLHHRTSCIAFFAFYFSLMICWPSKFLYFPKNMDNIIGMGYQTRFTLYLYLDWIVVDLQFLLSPFFGDKHYYGRLTLLCMGDVHEKPL